MDINDLFRKDIPSDPNEIRRLLKALGNMSDEEIEEIVKILSKED